MKKIFLVVFLISCVFVLPTFAQESEDIVEIIDALTIEWDSEAVKLETYDGIKTYCRNRAYRDNLIALLNRIHHYDTALYFIVIRKFDQNKDAEAKATLDDIETLEIDYTTQSFLGFLRQECMRFNDIERNKVYEDYSEQLKGLEEELGNYIKAITHRIDVIDEHVHHLNGL